MGGQREPGDGLYRDERPYMLLLFLWLVGWLVVFVDLFQMSRLFPPGTDEDYIFGSDALIWFVLTLAAVEAGRRRGIRVGAGGVAECRLVGQAVRASWSDIERVEWDLKSSGYAIIHTAQGEIRLTPQVTDWLRCVARVQAGLGLADPIDEPSAAWPTALRSGFAWSGRFCPLPRAKLVDTYGALTFDDWFAWYHYPLYLAVQLLVPPFEGWALLLSPWQRLRPGRLSADEHGLTAVRGRFRWSCEWVDVRHLEKLPRGYRLSTAQGELLWYAQRDENALIGTIEAVCAAQRGRLLPAPRPAIPNTALSRAAHPAGESSRALSLATPPKSGD